MTNSTIHEQLMQVDYCIFLKWKAAILDDYGDPRDYHHRVEFGVLQKRCEPDPRRLYAEIDQANGYDDDCNTMSIDLQEPIENIAASIPVLIKDHVGSANLDVDGDMFSHGMDSLEAIIWTKQLKYSIQVESKDDNTVGLVRDNINSRLLYTNPSANRLAIAPKRLFKAVGKENGDTLRSVEYGQPSNAADAGEIYQRLTSSTASQTLDYCRW